ncbi:PAS domain S-box protein [Thauera sp. 2A1]|uniref:PAS domain S-box protein n=1 Tax=Thauera sp. 2A1 TaxID=2570191 RepID=UPI0018853330|nr:PAS domain S-box protein [Thauera sp. 2A1]KAI5915236.1 PAS domain S-box protein [Thauera sp. 2A1]
MRQKALATLALALLAVAGNVLSVPLFFSVVFIFGSVAAMLAVALLGTLPAVLVAAAGGLYTLFLWGHPYALIVFTVEALVVGLLYRRGLCTLVLADLAYWLVLGVPLVLLSYHGRMGVGWEAATMIALKQALNGLFNALLAGLIVLGLQLWWRGAARLGLGAARLSGLLFHVLLTTILLAGAIPVILKSYGERVQLEAFMEERLAERARHLGTRLAAEPATTASRRVALLAGEQDNPGMGLALLAADGSVLARQGEVASLSGNAGELQPLAGGLAIWVPGGDMPAMARWKQGRYHIGVPVPEGGEVARLVIEQSAAPLVRALERTGLKLFAYLVGLLLMGIVLARVLSQWLTRPIAALEAASRLLTSQIASGTQPVLPASPVREYGSLGGSLREMAEMLASSFRELRETQAGLEARIRERTAALHGATELLESVLAASTFSIIATDTRGVIKVFNKGAEKLLGHAADEVVGKQTPAPFHRAEEVAARSAELSAALGHPVEGFRVFVEVAEREGSETREWTYVHRDGRAIPVSLVVSAMRAADGQLTGYVGIAEDITTRKAAERELRESAQRFRSMLETSPIAARIARAGGHEVIFSNRRYAELINAAADEVGGVDPSAYYVRREDYEAILQRLGRGEQIYDMLVELAIPGVGTKWALGSYSPIQYEGSPAVLGWFYDITDRMRSEAALAEQAQHTQTILDNMVDGLITIDAKGIVQSFNPAAERIFGYVADEVIGRNVKMLMPNPHREAHDGYLRNYQTTGVARIIGIGREVEGQRRDGSLFPMELAVSEITQHGQPLYVGMVRDISERKRMERMKSEFVSTVSHELRTPLTSISGALGLVAGGALGQLPEQARQMVGIAHKNSQRLTHLINDLLDMEKIAAGKLHFDMQVQPLMPIVQQAVESHRTYGTERRVALALKGEATDAELRVDSQRLMQVLANLLSNAIKFSPEGGTVEVVVRARGGKLRVAVVDHGPGIPASFRGRIFEKFSQADASDTRQKGGTGLGLAITRELVERMGGTIGFDSIEGEGATFWIEFPLHAAGEPAAPDGAPVVTAADAPRILVVEDDADIARLLSLMLTRAGYRVDIALTGREALAALQETAYAALSLDLMLPDIGGLEIIRQVRQRPDTADLPIMVVSAKMEEGRLAINGDFSAVDWLAKPFDESRLLAVVQGLLAQAGASNPRVLHVEDDDDLHQVVRSMVGERFQFERATTLREALDRVSRERFDVVVLDIGLPDGSGWDLLPDIRARQPDTRIVILSGADTTAEEARRVEAVLLKSQVSPKELIDALDSRIRSFRSRRSQA